MAKVTLGVEVRRYVTFEVDLDDIASDLHSVAEQAIRENSPELDWNAPEVDSVDILKVEEEPEGYSDQAYEERRDMVTFG